MVSIGEQLGDKGQEKKVEKFKEKLPGGFEFSSEMKDLYTNSGRDKKAIKRLEKYQQEIQNELTGIKENNKKSIDKNQFVLDFLNSKHTPPKKLVRILEDKMLNEKEESNDGNGIDGKEKVEVGVPKKTEETKGKVNGDIKKEVKKDTERNEKNRLIKEFGGKETVWENKDGDKIMMGEITLRATGKDKKSWRIIIVEKKAGKKPKADDLSEEKLRDFLNKGKYRRVEKNKSAEVTEGGIRSETEITTATSSKEKESTKEKFPTFEEFKGQFKKNADFIEAGKTYFDKNGNWIKFHNYNPETGIVTLLHNGRKKGETDLNRAFETFGLDENEEDKSEDISVGNLGEILEEFNLEEDPTEKKPEPEENKSEINSDKSIEDKIRKIGIIWVNDNGDELVINRIEKKSDGSEVVYFRENGNEYEAEFFQFLDLFKENKFKKEDKELEKLEKAVAEARKKYAAKDYEVTNALSRIKSVLGRNFSFKSNDEQATSTYFNQYKIALDDLLSYQTEKLKDSGSETEAELKSLIKYYNQDEKINLFEARTNARAEAWEKKVGKTPGYVLKKTGNLINSYRKMNWKKKMALGAALGITGAGFLIVGQKIISGASAGVGVTAGLEARHRKKEMERMSGEQEEIEKSLEGVKNQEEKYNLLMQKMQEEIDKSREDLTKEKSKAKKRRLIGLATAVGIVSAGYLAKHLVHWGLGEVESEHYSSAAKEAYKDDMIERISNSFKRPEVSDMTGGENHGGFLPGKLGVDGVGQNSTTLPVSGDHVAAVPEVTEDLAESHSDFVGGIEIAQKGDSVWQMAAKQLANHDGFSQLNPEQKTYIIDAFKDKIAENSSEFGLNDIDKIKIGQKIDFSKLFEDKNVVDKIFNQAKNLSPEQLSNIASNNKSILDWVHEHPGQSLSSGRIQEIIEQNASKPRGINNIIPTENAAEQAPSSSGSVGSVEASDSLSETSPPTENVGPVDSEGFKDIARGAAAGLDLSPEVAEEAVKEAAKGSGGSGIIGSAIGSAAGASAAGAGMAGRKAFENKGKIISTVE